MTSGSAEPGSRRSTAWAGYVAAGWALAFAAVSFYWAAGGRIGLETVAQTIREQAEARDAGMIALVGFTGVLKVLVALLALALVRPWGRVVPRWMLLTAGWGSGALLALYGALGCVSGGLAELGITETADPDAARWYFYLWGPFWLVGGLLMLAAARHYTTVGANTPSLRAAP